MIPGSLSWTVGWMALGFSTWGELGEGMQEWSIPTANWKASLSLKDGVTGEIHQEQGTSISD